MEPRRLKVLISAHELSPYQGSECSSGWNFITRMGRLHDVIVLYAETNQFETSNYQQHIADFENENGKIEGVTFISIKQPKITKLLSKLNKSISDKKSNIGNSFLFFYGYKFWQKKVYHKAIEIVNSQSIDVLHQFNLITFRDPGYLWKLDLPFFWGPTSGLISIPAPFLSNMPLKTRLFAKFREVINKFQFKTSKRIDLALKNAEKVYTVTKDDKLNFETKSKNIISLLDVGANVNQFIVKDKLAKDKLRIVWVGRLDLFKALDILLYAIKESPIIQQSAEIIVIGDGPDGDYFKKICFDHKINNVNWMGQIDKSEVSKIMLSSDLLVHTSIKEAGSAVILEALSSGLPIVCHDAFGMHHAINASCGFKIDFISPQKSIEGFKSVIELLLSDKNILTDLSSGALIRARELSWDAMVDTIGNDYYKPN